MFQYTSVSDEVQRRQRVRDHPNYVKVLYNDPDPILKDYSPTPCFVTEKYRNFDQAIKNFPVRDDDIYVISYPKTGTTLMSELVTVMRSGMDFEKLEETSLMMRSPYLELSALMETPVDFYEIAKSTSSQRVIKTHLPVNLLPTEMLTKSGHKMIYTIRNPKDAVVSVYHHFKNVHGYVGSFTDMLEGYLNGEIIYGSYFQHVEEYLRLSKIKQNLLLVSYEDMVTDMVKVVEQLSSFLDIPLSDTDIQKVADYVHFDKMKERKSSNFQDFAEEASSNGSGVATKFRFLRKGKKDSYKEEMPAPYIEKFNEEMKKWNGIMNIYPNC